MAYLPHPFDRMTRLATIMMCVSAVWFYTSCDATNRNVTERHALESAMKSLAPRFVPYEMLVKFKSRVSQERIVSILKGNRTDVIADPTGTSLLHQDLGRSVG